MEIVDEILRQKLQEQFEKRPAALEIVREFLRYKVCGAEPEDMEAQVKGFNDVNPFKVRQIIEAIEELAMAAHSEGFLSGLVAIVSKALMRIEEGGERVTPHAVAKLAHQIYIEIFPEGELPKENTFLGWVSTKKGKNSEIGKRVNKMLKGSRYVKRLRRL